MAEKLNNPIRIFSWSIIFLTFAFLINNVLNHWYDYPGVDKLFGSYNFFFESNKNLSSNEFYKSCIQFLIYLIAILISFIYVKLYNQVEINKDSEYLSNFSGYIIRSCFWAALIVGLVDMILSFLRVEDFLIPLFGKSLGMNLGKSVFRGTYIHFPLIILAFIIGYFTKTLGFFWLAFLVVIAEFQIVVARFIFSYEQTFMGDLVRFWYGSLFLFASSYALLKEGHVRVDILYTNFSEKGKAWSNLLGSLILGIPICATILLRGMWCQQCILNAPIKTFEQSMSGYGMQVKYLMAGFLAIYALTMLITFTSFFMSNSSKLLKTNSN
jgi:TRAP-type mannitol/chloroaromatic compound transport system permease small subunit